MKWSKLKYVFWPQGGPICEELYKPEEIVAKLRQVDVLVSQGQSMADAIGQIGERGDFLSLWNGESARARLYSW